MLYLNKNENYDASLISHINTIILSYKDINRYPDHINFNKVLSKFFNVPRDCVLSTAGCTEAIAITVRAYVSNTTNVLMLSPTYSYAVEEINKYTSNIFNIPTSTPFLKIKEYIIMHNINFFYLCNPNNPTGDLLNLSELIEIADVCKAHNCTLFIDETYYEYSNVTFISELCNYNNVIVGRSFSKAWALAGVRLGAILSTSSSIKSISKYRLKAAVSGIAIHIVCNLINNYDKILTAINTTKTGYHTLINYIESKDGVILSKPFANFIYFKSNRDIFQDVNIICRKHNENYYTVALASRDILKKYII